ncbi:MAG: ribosome hibernation-promoting factor, HPF/YfiA family [Angustibacter sp.]
MTTVDTSRGRDIRPQVQVTSRGDVPHRQEEYAAQKLADVVRYTRQSVRSVQVVLEISADPARVHPSMAEATLDVDGMPVRAHVAADRLHEAVDLLEARLRRQLVQLQDRTRTRHRWTRVVDEHEWRHGAEPTSRGEFFPRPVDEREVVRHKAFALGRQTLDEAAFDMELLGHEFYLFVDAASGDEAVVHRVAPGQYVRIGPPAVLTEAQAKERLDVGGEPFVFFRESAGRPAQVLYRRYDGHYGLITAA